MVHKLWLKVSSVPSRRKIHHRDVVRVALNCLERDMRGQSDVMLDFYKIEHEEAARKNDGSSNKGQMNLEARDQRAPSEPWWRG